MEDYGEFPVRGDELASQGGNPAVDLHSLHLLQTAQPWGGVGLQG